MGVHFPPNLTSSPARKLLSSHSSPTLSSDSDTEDMGLSNGSTRNGLKGGGGSSSSDKTSSTHPFRYLTPKRIAVAAAGLLFLIFFFGRSSGGGREGYRSKADQAIEKAPGQAQVKLDKLPSNSPQKQPSDGQNKCTPPPGKKATSYALMIDAGSTGSRLHLYTFSHCDPDPLALPKLEDEGFYTTKPGLSSYAGRPKDAAESLRGLMEHAIEGIPKSERGCTPVAVKATAGLRLLGQRQSDEILKETERWLRNEWPFSVVEDGVVVMDGKDEGTLFPFHSFLVESRLTSFLLFSSVSGVYAWITINFVGFLLFLFLARMHAHLSTLLCVAPRFNRT